jgi:uracil-DNA glycosylase family 4
MASAQPSREDLAALLRWYVDHGVDDVTGDHPVDRLAAPAVVEVRAGLALRATAPTPIRPAMPPLEARAPVPRAPVPRAPVPSAPVPSAPVPRAPVPLESPQIVEDARALAEGCTTLAELEAAVRSFEGCALKRTAKHTVFADGAPGAPVMIVGEAPGGDEDRLGKPFVGVSGQLMDRMMEAIGLTRSEGFYITNILFWRPPGNRTPTLAEQAMCLAFTRRHIELARPKVLVLAGGVSAKAILDTAEGIMRLRGKWHSYRLADGTEIPTMPTFHPAYLLRTPASKRQSWQDLLAIDRKLREIGLRS